MLEGESEFIPTQALWPVMALQNCPHLFCCSLQGSSSTPLWSCSNSHTFILTTSSSKAGWTAGSYSYIKPPWFSFFPTDPNAASLSFPLLPSLQLHAELGQAVMTVYPPEGSLPAQNHLITICEADSPSPRVWPCFLTQTATCARVTLVPELPELGTKAGKSWGEHSVFRTATILSSMQGQVFRCQPGDY